MLRHPLVYTLPAKLMFGYSCAPMCIKAAGPSWLQAGIFFMCWGSTLSQAGACLKSSVSYQADILTILLCGDAQSILVHADCSWLACAVRAQLRLSPAWFRV